MDAVAQINSQMPNQGESFGDYYRRLYGTFPDSFIGKWQNLMGGDVSAARERYNQWYDEQSAVKKAQADYEMTRLLNQTQYSDVVKSLRDAGLNPYVLLSNGGISAGNMQYNASEAPSHSSEKKSSSLSGKAIGAIALIVAALIKAIA